MRGRYRAEGYGSVAWIRTERRMKVKRGLSIIIGLGLLLSSFGCFVERRDDDYRRHREEYREREEHRDQDRWQDRNHDEHRDSDERRDYDDRRY